MPKPISTKDAEAVRSLRDCGNECSAHGAQYVAANNPVQAREWFECAKAAYAAAYELDVDDE